MSLPCSCDIPQIEKKGIEFCKKCNRMFISKRYTFIKDYSEFHEYLEPEFIYVGYYLILDNDGKYKLFTDENIYTECRYPQKSIDKWLDGEFITN